MFQNIAEEEKTEKVTGEEAIQDKLNFREVIKKIFTKQKLILGPSTH